MLGKLILFLLIGFCVAKSMWGGIGTEYSPQKGKRLQENFNGTWITDEEFFYKSDDQEYYKFNAASSESSVFLKGRLNVYRNATYLKFFFWDTELFAVGYSNLTRRKKADPILVDLYDLDTGERTKINGGKEVQRFLISSIRNRLAYIYRNNVYVHFEDGSEIRLTNDGVPDVVWNGGSGWWFFYLDLAEHIWWSPDGKKLAFLHHNASNVQLFSYPIYESDKAYYQIKNRSCPKPGTPIGETEFRVFDLNNRDKKEFTPLKIRAPVDIVKRNFVFGFAWIESENFLLYWINRCKTDLIFQRCTLEGHCQELARFQELDGWIKMGRAICPGSKACYFQYWIGNWYQVWKLDLETGKNLWKSRGNFTVTTLYGYDEKDDKLYYKATLPGESYVSHVFVNDDCLSCSLRDVDNKYCRLASASFSKNYKYCAVICGGPGVPYIRVMETQTKRLIMEWESNTDPRKRLIANPLFSTKRYMNVTLGDGSTGTAVLFFPLNFDANKKYPLLVETYGGPDFTQVDSMLISGLVRYFTPLHQLIYGKIDGRGSANKGKKILYAVKNRLGTFESQDQIVATKYLQDRFSFIDRYRTCIWGWSYGGYNTGRVIAQDSENVFRCGVSVAAVTSWIYYSPWVEPFMDLPTRTGNLENYIKTSISYNVTKIKHRWLIVHGTGDDNVHLQHFLQLTKILSQRGIMFDQMVYVNDDHNLRGSIPHFKETLKKFIWDNFNLV